MTPRRRTLILAALTFGTTAILLSAAYVGYQATIGGNGGDSCSATPSRDSLAMHAVRFSSRQRWRWLPPRYVATCLYQMPNGSTIARNAR